MKPWFFHRDRTRQKEKVLQLLTFSGAVRKADVEPPYLGSERISKLKQGRPRSMPAHTA